jgi:hypothetical protein
MEERSGVYTQEIDKSEIIVTGISNGVGNVVVSERGQINTATLITSPTQLISKFGSPDIQKYGMSLIQALMCSEATNINFINRVVPLNAKYANGKIVIDPSLDPIENPDPFRYSSTGFTLDEFNAYEFVLSDATSLLTISSANPGKWGSNVGFRLSDMRKSDDGSFQFNLEVFEYRNGTPIKVESYEDIYSNDGELDGYGNSAFAEDVVNGTSEYIKIWINPYFSVNMDDFSQSQLAAFYSHFDTIISLGGGLDGEFNADGEGSLTSIFSKGYDIFSNPEIIAINFLGDANQGLVIQQKTLSVAKLRDDATAIHSSPLNKTSAAELLEFRQTQNINDSYGALYGGVINAKSALNNKTVKIPLSFYALKAQLENAGSATPWNPCMWFNGGIISSSYFIPLSSAVNYENGEQNLLAKNQVNYPLTKIGRGIVLSDESTELTKKSAFQEIHIRETLNLIKSNCKTFLEYVIGKTNTASLRTGTKGKVDQYLREMLQGGALTGFTAICDDTNNTPQVIDSNNFIIDLLLKFPRVVRRVLIRATVVGSNIALSEEENA